MSDDRWTEEDIIPLAQRPVPTPEPVVHQASAEDYPYDMALAVSPDRQNLRGLDRLRIVACRATAACLFDLYQTSHPSVDQRRWRP